MKNILVMLLLAISVLLAVAIVLIVGVSLTIGGGSPDGAAWVKVGSFMVIIEIPLLLIAYKCLKYLHKSEGNS